jgi:hypothetical protein
LSRRFSAVFVTLALVAGQAGVCAGWMPTPEARMRCCSDEAPCPMHKSDSEDDGAKRVVSQAEADTCCAASENDTSAPSSSTFNLNVPLAVFPSPLHVVLPATATPTSARRTLIPLPLSHVPKHVLLSVFLV